MNAAVMMATMVATLSTGLTICHTLTPLARIADDFAIAREPAEADQGADKKGEGNTEDENTGKNEQHDLQDGHAIRIASDEHFREPAKLPGENHESQDQQGDQARPGDLSVENAVQTTVVHVPRGYFTSNTAED